MTGMSIARNLTRDTIIADRLTVADTFRTRLVGLIGTCEFGAGQGLWFPGEASVHMMFMGFAIDVVFLGKADAVGQRMVLGIREGLRPWVGLAAYRKADGVLELPVNSIITSQTMVGDLVSIA